MSFLTRAEASKFTSPSLTAGLGVSKWDDFKQVISNLFESIIVKINRIVKKALTGEWENNTSLVTKLERDVKALSAQENPEISKIQESRAVYSLLLNCGADRQDLGRIYQEIVILEKKGTPNKQIAEKEEGEEIKEEVVVERPQPIEVEPVVVEEEVHVALPSQGQTNKSIPDANSVAEAPIHIDQKAPIFTDSEIREKVKTTIHELCELVKKQGLEGINKRPSFFGVSYGDSPLQAIEKLVNEDLDKYDNETLANLIDERAFALDLALGEEITDVEQLNSLYEKLNDLRVLLIVNQL